MTDSRKIRPLQDFESLNETLGLTRTAEIYREKKSQDTYVIKNKKVIIYGTRTSYNEEKGIFTDCSNYARRRLTNEEVASEKIAFDLLKLCGVNVPKTTLVQFPLLEQKYDRPYTLSMGQRSEMAFYTGIEINNTNPKYKYLSPDIDEIIQENCQDTLGIASQKIENAKTLDQILGIETESHPKQKEARTKVLAEQKINGKPIKGLFENLPIFEFIFDYDAIGFSISNVLFVEKEDCYETIKIDPGSVMLDEKKFPGETNPFQQKKMNTFFTNKCILDDMQRGSSSNLREAYQNIQPEQKLAGIKKVIQLTDEQIANTVNKSCDDKFLPALKKQSIIETLKMRRELFRDYYYQIPLRQPTTAPTPQFFQPKKAEKMHSPFITPSFFMLLFEFLKQACMTLGAMALLLLPQMNQNVPEQTFRPRVP